MMSDEEDADRPSFGRGGIGSGRVAADDASDEDQRPSIGGGMSFRAPTGFSTGFVPDNEHEDAPPTKKMKFSRSMGFDRGSASPASGGKGGGGGGFAARMMAKMGYKEGEGLGAEGRGRLAPIDAQLRPQKVGLGAVKEKTKQAKEEEKRAAAFRGEVLEDSEEEERKRKKEARKRRQEQGLSGIAPGQRRPKTKYRTAAEIEVESNGLEVPNVLKSLIDVTGKETQFMPSGSGVMVPQETEASKIAKRARRDLEAFADEWNTLKERNTYFDMENEQVVGDIDREAQDIKHIQEIIHAVEGLQALSLDHANVDINDEYWEGLTKRLESIEVDFKDDLSKFGIHEMAVAAIQQAFRKAMLDWQPLEEPDYLVGYITRLQHIIGVDSGHGSADAVLAIGDGENVSRPKKRSTTHYETLLYTLWLPPVRSAITNSWNVEDPEPLEKLVTSWKPLLPQFILKHIFDQLIIPRLITALSAWKPGRTSGLKSKSRTASPPHHWLFPWLEYLPPSHLDSTSHAGLAVELRRKIRSLFSHHDISSGIPPWLLPLRSPLLTPPVLNKLTITHLLPRLAAYLADAFIIDPSDQQLEPLEAVLSYLPLFKPEAFAELLAAGFFPKFHATLHAWLTADPDYDEVRQWFVWWQEQIPEALRQVPAVERQWEAALHMVNAALELGQKAGSELPTVEAFLPAEKQILQGGDGDRDRSDKSGRRRRRGRNAEMLEAEPVPKTNVEDIGFRDVVEAFCSQEGLLFMPLREAHPTNGAPLLRITAGANGKGGVVCYIQGDILYARSGKKSGGEGVERWKPIGLGPELRQLAGG